VGYIGAGLDPIARLCDELELAGAHVVRVSSPVQAETTIRVLVERFSIRRAVLNSGAVIDDLKVPDVMQQAGVEVCRVAEMQQMKEPARLDRFFAADLGVAAADWVIAETGTLVYVADSEQARSTTLVCPVLLAIVDSRVVLPDLMDLPKPLAARSIGGVLPPNIALITGPSKTGDIELRLTTGVHGPGEVHVVVWDRC
jgi:L-lactate utilization protein LutC